MLNIQIFFFFYNFAHQSVFFDWLAVFFAQTFPYILILFSIIFLLYHHDILKSEKPFAELALKWKEIILVFFSGIFAWTIAQIIKISIHTLRPHLILENVVPLLDKNGFSFPSGHATFFMALAFAIFFSHKKMGYLFIFFAFLIGIARIITGVHFPIDILGGFILGTIIACFVKFIYDRLQKPRKNF